MRCRARVEAKPFFRLPEVPAHDVGEFFQLDPKEENVVKALEDQLGITVSLDELEASGNQLDSFFRVSRVPGVKPLRYEGASCIMPCVMPRVERIGEIEHLESRRKLSLITKQGR